MEHLTEKTMICPCCGTNRSQDNTACPNCHARAIDEPLVQPRYKLPSLGPALLAFSIVAIILLSFLGAWLLTNDMRVLRVLAVSALGDSTLFTKNLLQGDPDLLRYKIFSFDAYRLATLLSIGAIPLSLLGFGLTRRAQRLQRTNPVVFGGQKIAAVSLVLSILFFVAFGTAGVSAIPRLWQNGQTKRIAATRAQLYHLHAQALQKYYQELGTYPQELDTLQEHFNANLTTFDVWGQKIGYSPTGVIAAKSSVPVFSNYQLVSAGPDGVLDTADDIRMIDGVIVSRPDTSDPITGFFSSNSDR